MRAISPSKKPPVPDALFCVKTLPVLAVLSSPKHAASQAFSLSRSTKRKAENQESSALTHSASIAIDLYRFYSFFISSIHFAHTVFP